MAKQSTKKALTKSQFIGNLAEASGLAKKDVQTVFDALSHLIKEQLGKKGPEQITIPGLLKIRVRHRPAQPAKKNVKNPLTGVVGDVPAKPAKRVVRATALKALKEMVD